jgi:hypothetical protein
MRSQLSAIAPEKTENLCVRAQMSMHCRPLKIVVAEAVFAGMDDFFSLIKFAFSMLIF